MNPATVQDLTNNAGKVKISNSKLTTHHHSDFLDLPCEAEACCDKFAFMAIHISICLVIVSMKWNINGARVSMFLSLDIFAVH